MSKHNDEVAKLAGYLLRELMDLTPRHQNALPTRLRELMTLLHKEIAKG